MRDLADDVFADEEPPTRESGVVARQFARETEALIACGGDPKDAQGFVETVRPNTAMLGDDWEKRLEEIARLTVSNDDLQWFALSGESATIAAAIDGTSTLSAVLARVGLSPSSGLAHLAMLVEMGVVTFDSTKS